MSGISRWAAGAHGAERLSFFGWRAFAVRVVLALGLLVALCASADAATAHRSRPRTTYLRAPQDVIVRPGQDVRPPARFAVPGWTDEETRRWLDNANSCSSCGG
jgi:hypothetical protein